MPLQNTSEVPEHRSLWKREDRACLSAQISINGGGRGMAVLLCTGKISLLLYTTWLMRHSRYWKTRLWGMSPKYVSHLFSIVCSNKTPVEIIVRRTTQSLRLWWRQNTTFYVQIPADKGLSFIEINKLVKIKGLQTINLSFSSLRIKFATFWSMNTDKITKDLRVGTLEQDIMKETFKKEDFER